MAREKLIKLEQQEQEFVNHYAELGFANPDEMIKKGLHLLKEELNYHAQLAQSADLYAELYDEDEKLKEWTESATQDWD
ncbi:MAG: hypothetical protein WBA23_04215 [Tunicatimonas sp.]|uniref:hypothetical protein n=1 Tax=Tunicatimonas sp. TaxID=1940096 RepID=UPI003C77B1F6